MKLVAATGRPILTLVFSGFAPACPIGPRLDGAGALLALPPLGSLAAGAPLAPEGGAPLGAPGAAGPAVGPQAPAASASTSNRAMAATRGDAPNGVPRSTFISSLPGDAAVAARR